MIKSLELNWIRNEDKSLVLPTVVFAPLSSYSGYYVSPRAGEREIEGGFYDLHFGLIVVSTLNPENVAATLAHEWRHHWQACNGWVYDGIGWHSQSPANYDRAIKEYFTRSRCEFDALRFEWRKARCEVNEYWRGILSNLDQE
jgi:hypothetical protein